jgi:hypothetical protein
MAGVLDCTSLFWAQYAKEANASTALKRESALRQACALPPQDALKAHDNNLSCANLFWAEYAKMANDATTRKRREEVARRRPVGPDAFASRDSLSCANLFWAEYAKMANNATKRREEVAARRRLTGPDAFASRGSLSCADLFWKTFAESGALLLKEEAARIEAGRARAARLATKPVPVPTELSCLPLFWQQWAQQAVERKAAEQILASPPVTHTHVQEAASLKRKRASSTPLTGDVEDSKSGGVDCAQLFWMQWAQQSSPTSTPLSVMTPAATWAMEEMNAVPIDLGSPMLLTAK